MAIWNSVPTHGGGAMPLKRWRWGLLIFELFLFALILVLPQVDLPDFTFHRGSAPVAAKAKLISPPVAAVVATPGRPKLTTVIDGVEVLSSLLLDSRSSLSLLCVLLC